MSVERYKYQGRWWVPQALFDIRGEEMMRLQGELTRLRERLAEAEQELAGVAMQVLGFDEQASPIPYESDGVRDAIDRMKDDNDTLAAEVRAGHGVLSPDGYAYNSNQTPQVSPQIARAAYKKARAATDASGALERAKGGTDEHG